MWVSVSQCMQPHETKSSSFTLCISWLSWLFSVEPDIQGYFGKYSQIGLREDDCWFLPFFAWSKTGGSAWEARSRSRGWKLSGCCGLQWQLCVCVFVCVCVMISNYEIAQGSFPAFHGRSPNIFGKTTDLYPNKAPASLLPVLPNVLLLSVDRPVLLMLLLNQEFCASWNFYACFSRHCTTWCGEGSPNKLKVRTVGWELGEDW